MTKNQIWSLTQKFSKSLTIAWSKALNQETDESVQNSDSVTNVTDVQ